jgi:hypothetical protein
VATVEKVAADAIASRAALAVNKVFLYMVTSCGVVKELKSNLVYGPS